MDIAAFHPCVAILAVRLGRSAMTPTCSNDLLFAFILSTVVFSNKVTEKPHMMTHRAIRCYVFAITVFFPFFELTDVFAAVGIYYGALAIL